MTNGIVVALIALMGSAGDGGRRLDNHGQRPWAEGYKGQTRAPGEGEGEDHIRPD